MLYFATKTLITALIVAAISELARRFSLMAALLASLPLTSILAFIWIYVEQRDATPLIEMSHEIFWLVLPSLAFFLIFPFLLKLGWSFAPALLSSCAMMALLYSGVLFIQKLVS